MCEIPSNVVLAEEFLRVFDGFSIGSNDLTQLTLGLDRDSGTVAHLFDERNEAVRWLIARAIEAAQDAGKPIGICGQAPSDYPDFAAWLVERGDRLDLAEPGRRHRDGASCRGGRAHVALEASDQLCHELDVMNTQFYACTSRRPTAYKLF